jgi:hypothetical protein
MQRDWKFRLKKKALQDGSKYFSGRVVGAATDA